LNIWKLGVFLHIVHHIHGGNLNAGFYECPCISSEEMLEDLIHKTLK